MARPRRIQHTIWTMPSPSDFKRWEALILSGADPSHAAKDLGFGGSSTFKRTDPVQHAAVLEVWRERRDADDVKLARDTLREITRAKKAPAAARVTAAATLGKAAGMFDETQRIEVSVPDGISVTVEDARERLARLVAQRALADSAAGGAGEPQ